MATFVIQGGKRLSGRHRSPGNKNAALPMLAAAVLTDEPVRLRNVPLIEDVRTMLAILEDIGVQVAVRGHSVTLRAGGLRKRRLDGRLCRMVRSSVLFAGPLAARHGRAAITRPGGDGIGRRGLDAHFAMLAGLGIRVRAGGDQFVFRREKLRGARLLLDEASVTATENAVMAACLAEGETTLFNAACEPHVQDLCHMLNKMGAHIRGVGTNYLRIHGVPRLGGVSHTVSSDYTDTFSFAAAAALTGGELTVDAVAAEQCDVVCRPFRKLGVKWSLAEGRLVLPGDQALRVRNDFGAAIPRIEDGPWPSLPSDLMSVSLVLATQAKGTVLFFEKMFESRMYFVDRLIQMGARIVQCDPHRVIVSGPARLHGLSMSSPDIRAGMALLLAALCARGESRIANAESIDRGYERVEQRLRGLGADIVRVE
ncbi:MAG: UDP-N-acetylglucosamine 1-carboxyvinyltransferase [Lentisphaerae bacterium]|nr:UDP-N-acetylglucosamine 1-carboxyvinyltransferase [Lentisphaerota bacterium]